MAGSVTWREEDHPRDDDGKFTFKNGGASFSNNEEEKNIKRANILYPTMKDEISTTSTNVKLNGKISNNNLTKLGANVPDNLELKLGEVKDSVDVKIKYMPFSSKISSFILKIPKILANKNANSLKTNLYEAAVKYFNKDDFEIMMLEIKKHPKAASTLSLYFNLPDACEMLKISEGNESPKYMKNVIKFSNINNLPLSLKNNQYLKQSKEYMEDKINKQFKDFNYNSSDVKGYYFSNDSKAVQDIKKSPKFKDILTKHQKEIRNGQMFSDSFNGDDNLYYAFNKVDFLNPRFDSKGNIHLNMFDTYDFNKGESNLVQAGRELMQEGKLKPFFSIHDIIIKKDELKNYGF